ncbi:Conserved membrane protein [Nocardia cyriacigeorgica GUH-2]|uniref:Conserved membrane protein n=1 Tax=Nocardia cyriacigeorgica (strain GUH-2) TaxID=1127134 RepID=H6RCF5_NOCCG|nr:Conserved membrane protein [Nocardia cyriacigeorgica GUH-2]
MVDYAEWSKGTRSEKIRPMARHWAEVGFGTPVALHLFYVVKIALYILAAWLIVLSTSGIDGFTAVGTWWTEPIVFQKVVLFTMLFEVVGLGCGFGPLNNRFFPPMGSILYWLRPGTIRLPPWPGRVPLTAGTARTPVDALLYGALLILLLVALFSDGTGPIPELDTTVGVLPTWQIVAILAVLGVLGLRDKVIFLAARGEVYGSFTVVFLFSGVDMIVAAKIVFVVIWLGAAISKLNKHFPFVVSTMMSNNPVLRPKAVKRMFFERFPDDLRPGRPSRVLAHGGTAVELLVPLVLFFSHGGWPTAIAAIAMICFHLTILVAIPMGVPLEWNVFMIFGVLTMFVGHADLGLAQVDSPALLALVFAVLIGIVIAGNLFPAKISFLPGMRYYAGNWDTTLWCIKPSADAKIRAGIIAVAAMPAAQLERYYGSKEAAQIPLYLGYAFRSFNTHGRALFTLAHRAMTGNDEAEYTITDGERICSTALGWNFGDGHLHNEQLIEALHQRCGFEPGEVRVVLLDAQPIHTQTQRYRLVDAATGEFERGTVRVEDMVTRQPWDDELPVYPDTADETSRSSR